MALAEVIVGNERCGGAEHGFGELGSKVSGGVFGILLLMISGFVRFVNNNKAEVFDGRKKRGARADDDLWLVGGEDFLPELMT